MQLLLAGGAEHPQYPIWSHAYPGYSLCLPGFVSSTESAPCQVLVIVRSLFLTRKLIASHWVLPNTPTVSKWISEMNKFVMFEKHTYMPLANLKTSGLIGQK